MLDIKKLRELREKATEGRYEFDYSSADWGASIVTDDGTDVTFVAEDMTNEDAEYFSEAVNALPEALDEIERLTAALQEIADYWGLTGEDAREMKDIARSALGGEQ